VSAVGAVETPVGVVVATEDALPRPAALRAETRNLYEVPFVSPAMVTPRPPTEPAATDHVAPSLLDISIEYELTVDPPSDEGAVHARATEVSPAVATNDAGAPGTVRGVVTVDALGIPAPPLLIAVTRKRYEVPFVRPVAIAVVAVEPVFATTEVQVTPASVERSMR
jgi:hypothetical protein